MHQSLLPCNDLENLQTSSGNVVSHSASPELEGGNEYKEGHPRGSRDKAYWTALRQERRRLIRENRATHLDAWQRFQCATAGLPTDYVKYCESLVGIQTTALDVEDLNEAQWNDIPATDQVFSVGPISRPKRRGGGQNTTAGGGVRKHGRPPGPPKFYVRFLPTQTPASWVGGVGGMGGQ